MSLSVEQKIHRRLTHKYVQRADERQAEMGLSYTEAETGDLAFEMNKLFWEIFVSEIHDLIGYVQGATDCTLKVFQDDATRSYFVQVGSRRYYSESLGEALRQALVDAKSDE